MYFLFLFFIFILSNVENILNRILCFFLSHRKMQNHCVNAYPTTCWHTHATKYGTLVEIKNILSMQVSPSVNIFFVQFANLLYITVEHKSHIFISKNFQSVTIEFYKWRWWCAVYGYKKDDLIRCILWTHMLENNSQSVFFF